MVSGGAGASCKKQNGKEECVPHLGKAERGKEEFLNGWRDGGGFRSRVPTEVRREEVSVFCVENNFWWSLAWRMHTFALCTGT